MGYDNWIDDSEYPDDDDIEAFGYDSPPDDHPLTIGYVGDRANEPSAWTGERLFVMVIVAVIIAALVVPLVLFLLR